MDKTLEQRKMELEMYRDHVYSNPMPNSADARELERREKIFDAWVKEQKK